MANTNLKDLVRQDLNNVKQQELELKKEKNKNLKEVTIYTSKKSLHTKGFREKMFEYFDSVNIKYNEKDIEINPHIRVLIQQNITPIIEINGEYLVWQRDFQSYIQAETILQNIATEDYTSPPLNEKIYQSIKNLTQVLNNSSRGTKNSLNVLQQQLLPVTQLMKEISEESNKDEQKNN